MSLLLDALKRAESGKQNPTSSLSLEPVETGSKNKDLGASLSAAIPEARSTRQDSQQQAAQAVFTAKQPPPHNRALWLLLGGLSLLSIAAGVFWLWYMLSYPQNRMPTIPVGSPAIQPRPLIPPAQAQAVAPVVKTETKTDVPDDKLKSSDDKLKPSIETVPTIKKSAPVVSEMRPKAPLPKVIASDASQPAFGRSVQETPAVNPTLANAYQALLQQNFTIAKQQYQRVIQEDPFNIDAYLGLATIAASTGDPVLAQKHYRKALEIDPKNSVAQAGLAALQLGINASTSENQLRAQVAAQPDAVTPNSTLGHAFAAQNKWHEAQQAFFEAYRLEPLNPDNAFNLAVSLDRLKQYKLAREYYTKALSLSASRSASFSKAEVTTRMEQLAP